MVEVKLTGLRESNSCMPSGCRSVRGALFELNPQQYEHGCPFSWESEWLDHIWYVVRSDSHSRKRKKSKLGRKPNWKIEKELHLRLSRNFVVNQKAKIAKLTHTQHVGLEKLRVGGLTAAPCLGTKSGLSFIFFSFYPSAFLKIWFLLLWSCQMTRYSSSCSHEVSS